MGLRSWVLFLYLLPVALTVVLSFFFLPQDLLKIKKLKNISDGINGSLLKAFSSTPACFSLFMAQRPNFFFILLKFNVRVHSC